VFFFVFFVFFVAVVQSRRRGEPASAALGSLRCGS
jgi:hypothetical protein